MPSSYRHILLKVQYHYFKTKLEHLLFIICVNTQSWGSYFMKVIYYILLVTFMKKWYITVTYYSIKKVTRYYYYFQK